MKKLRMVSGVLAMAMLLAACGSKGGDASNSTANENKNYVFKEEETGFGEPEENVYQMVAVDDKVYMEQYIYPESEDKEPRVVLETAVEAASSDALIVEDEEEKEAALKGEEIQNNAKTIRKITGYDWDGNQVSEVSLELDNNASGGNFTVDKEGNLYTILHQYATYVGEDTQDKAYLIAYSPAGEELWRMDLNENPNPDEYYYVNYFCRYQEDKLLLEDAKGISIFDMQGNPVKHIDKSQEEVDSRLIKIKGDQFAYFSYTGEKAYAQTMDIETQTLGEKIDLPFNYYRYQIYSGMAYDIYLVDDYGIYGYNIGDEQITKVMDFIASDFGSYYLNNVVFLDENSFLGLYYNQEGTVLHKFVKVAPEDVVDKIDLTLGCYYLDYRIKEQLIRFNKESETYRVYIKDYSSYDTMDDYTQGLTKLNTDVVSGDIPDILILNSPMPVNSYIAKGVFADLNTFIEKDTQFKKEDYLPNVLEALSSGDGLYRIAPSFSVTTLAGKTADVGATPGWTMDQALALLASKPEGTQLMGDMVREGFLYNALFMNSNKYINWETGECFFDSDDFIKVLEFANTLPKEIDPSVYDDDTYWQEMETQYRNGKTLLSYLYMGQFADYNRCAKGTFGEPITLIGFPVGEGIGAALNFNSQFAISAQSKNKDAAWEFVKKFFEDEYQDKLEYEFPVKLSSLQKAEEKSWEKPYYLDENGQKVEYDDTYYIGGVEVVIDPLTPEESKMLADYIKGINRMSGYDEDLNKIIIEEADSFFAGQKSAKEAADIIQSRAKIYVNESR